MRTWISVLVAAAALGSATVMAGGAGRGLADEETHAVSFVAGRSGSARSHRAVARTYSLQRAAAEPTIAFVGRDMFVPTAELGGSQQVDVLRSRDGRDWTEVSPRQGGVKTHPVTLDPYVYSDEATGRLFNVDLTVACSFLSFSDDRGQTWTTNPLACGRPVNDHQTLFSAPPVRSTTVGYRNVVYYCFNDTEGSHCSKSLDGGMSFVPTGAPAFSPLDSIEGEVCPMLHGHGVAAPNGTIFLPKEHCDQPWLAISRDEGLTWTRLRVAGMGAANSDPSVAVDGAGNVYYAWIGRDRLAYLVTSRDDGKTWSRPVRVSAPGVTEANLLTIAASDRPGRVALAYVGSSNSPFQRCENASQCDLPYASVTWDGHLGVIARGLSSKPAVVSARINPPSRPLVRGRCGPGRCWPIWDFIDVAISPKGEPWGAYVRGTGPRSGIGVVAVLRGAPALAGRPARQRGPRPSV